jgi:hypothetical protein
MAATGQFTVVYDGSVTSTLSTCYSCTARYNASTSTATLNYAMTNSSGGINTTGVGIVIQPKSGGGQEVYVGLSENNPSLAAQYQGLYTLGTGTAMYVPLTGSCVTTTQLDLRNGGGVAGSLNCSVVGGSGASPIHATVSGSFSGTFPP